MPQHLHASFGSSATYRRVGPRRRGVLPAALGLLVAAFVAAGSLAAPASAAVLDSPGELVNGTVASFSGTCDDSAASHARLDVSWDTGPINTSTFEVGSDGTWTGRRYVTGVGPATVTVSCAVETGPGDYRNLGEPFVLDVERVEPSIEAAVTVGTDPAECATTSQLTVPAGTTVYWCITVTNRAGDVMWAHEISDTESGILVTDLDYELPADGSTSNVAQSVVASSVVDAPVTNTMTWSSYGLDGSQRYGEVSASDEAQVLVEDDAETTTTTTPGTTTTTPGATTTSVPPTVEAPPATPLSATVVYTG